MAYNSFSGPLEVADLLPCTAYKLQVSKDNLTIHSETFRTEPNEDEKRQLEDFELMQVVEVYPEGGTGLQLTWRDRCSGNHKVITKLQTAIERPGATN